MSDMQHRYLQHLQLMVEDGKVSSKQTDVAAPLKPIISELQLRHRTAQLAEKIGREYRDKEPIIVVVLKGAFVFAADLVRRLYEYDLKPDLDFIRAFSYGSDDKSSGRVAVELDVSIDLKGRQVLLIDDIVDSGRTLAHLKQHLLSKGAAEVKCCVMLDKPSRREVQFSPDWVGFEIADVFVVGYGMDYAERYRYLPYITAVDQAGRI